MRNKRVVLIIPITLLMLVAVGSIFTVPAPADAEHGIELQLQYPKIPGTSDTLNNLVDPEKNPDWLTVPNIIIFIFQAAIWIGALIALISLVYVGFLFATSAGGPTRRTQARNKLKGIAFGILILVGSFFLVDIVNPELSSLRFFQEGVCNQNVECKDPSGSIVLGRSDPYFRIEGAGGFTTIKPGGSVVLEWYVPITYDRCDAATESESPFWNGEIEFGQAYQATVSDLQPEISGGTSIYQFNLVCTGSVLNNAPALDKFVIVEVSSETPTDVTPTTVDLTIFDKDLKEPKTRTATENNHVSIIWPDDFNNPRDFHILSFSWESPNASRCDGEDRLITINDKSPTGTYSRGLDAVFNDETAPYVGDPDGTGGTRTHRYAMTCTGGGGQATAEIFIIKHVSDIYD